MELNDFLSPRSMFTPGIAGAVVMLIANTLWVEFSLPQKWSALILSFLIVVLTLTRFSAPFVEKLIYFFFNGLIVFAFAVNTNLVAGKITNIDATKANKQSYSSAPALNPNEYKLKEMGNIKNNPNEDNSRAQSTAKNIYQRNFFEAWDVL